MFFAITINGAGLLKIDNGTETKIDNLSELGKEEDGKYKY
jgi:hypothetical protein